MSGYPPELVDAVAAELAAQLGYDWMFDTTAPDYGRWKNSRQIHLSRARRILDVLDREGALHRSTTAGKWAGAETPAH